MHTHSCSLSQAGHNGWWENPPQRALIATGSAVQKAQVCVSVFECASVCVCVSVAGSADAWLLTMS